MNIAWIWCSTKRMFLQYVKYDAFHVVSTVSTAILQHLYAVLKYFYPDSTKVFYIFYTKSFLFN